MVQVLSGAWALLLGIGLLMVGNGMQGTLLGVRGEIEGFSTTHMSIVMSAYFAGFLFGSRAAPTLIRRVGHVRVFAALASLISAVMILYPALTNPWVWVAARVLIGFCFSAVYVTAESWLNNAASNETRGQALSLYMIVQTGGLVIAQGLLLVGDPSGFLPFVIPSILVSLAVTPILLSISPTPAFESTKPMSLKKLWTSSPLGCVGLFFLGGVFAAQFGMSSVYATQAGLNLVQLSTFVATFFASAMLTQYPIGWISDRVDRRFLVVVLGGLGAVGAIVGTLMAERYIALLASAFLIGGTATPLYSLLIAHTNDFLDHEDMASASGGLIFINGLGAVAGPLIVGAMMERYGPPGFFIFTLVLFLALVCYAIYRSFRRASIAVEDTGAYVVVTPAATTHVGMEYAQEFAIESDQEITDGSQPVAE